MWPFTSYPSTHTVTLIPLNVTATSLTCVLKSQRMVHHPGFNQVFTLENVSPRHLTLARYGSFPASVILANANTCMLNLPKIEEVPKEAETKPTLAWAYIILPCLGLIAVSTSVPWLSILVVMEQTGTITLEAIVEAFAFMVFGIVLAYKCGLVRGEEKGKEDREADREGKSKKEPARELEESEAAHDDVFEEAFEDISAEMGGRWTLREDKK